MTDTGNKDSKSMMRAESARTAEKRKNYQKQMSLKMHKVNNQSKQSNLEDVKFRGTNLDISSRKREESLEDKANFFSKFFLFYLNPVFETGAHRLLNPEDLGGTPEKDQAEVLNDAFQKEWAKELKKKPEKRSLWYTMIRAVGWMRLLVGVTLYGVYAVSTFIPVIILNGLVRHFDDIAPLSTPMLWTYVSLMLIVPILGSVAAAQNGVVSAHIGTEFRNIVIGAIYRKALVLSNYSRQESSTGQIVNMFSNEATQIQQLMLFISMIIFAPAQIAVALALIYMQVGDATWVGLAFMIALFPVNGLIFHLMTTIRKKKVLVTDGRVKMMNEILQGIRIIKFYAWEDAFREKVNAIRGREMVLLTQLAWVVAIGFSLILLSAPIVQPVLVFYTYVRLGNHLDAATAFTTIALFNIMRMPFAFLPMGLAQWSQARVSLRRMAKFLHAEELGENVKTIEDDPSASAEAATPQVVVRLRDMNVSWVLEADDEQKEKDKKKQDKIDWAMGEKKGGGLMGKPDTGDKTVSKPDNEGQLVVEEGEKETTKLNRSVHTLMDINVEIKQGQLVAVVGSVGSGKTSFMSAILGELHVGKGSIERKGTIAYCDQRPWILNATLKDNVTFGTPYEEEKFYRALRVSALEDDIKVLPGGVLTEIGERGINLSGGQKARVALARAVYRNADMYLLDDPLSAVDAHVGQHIFQECLVEELRGKTRILVTHHVHLLPQCDMVIVLVDGKVQICGTYEELQQSDLDLTAVGLYKDEEQKGEGTSEEEEKEGEESGETSEGKDGKIGEQVISSSTSSPDKSAEKEGKDKPKLDSQMSSLITNEERDQGHVNKNVYWYYLTTGGLHWYFLLLIIMLAATGLEVGSAFWLAFWAEKSLNDDLTSEENKYYLDLYAVICMMNVVGLTIRGIVMAQHRLYASLKLHANLLVSILGSTASFFDITPLGRILNRFSSDILVVDETLSQTLSQLVNSVFMVLGAVAAMAAATKGTFLVLMVPLLFIYNRVQLWFRKTNTEIQRLQSTSLSPIYADFSQALVGVGTIRAYGLLPRFIDQMQDSVDRNSVSVVMLQTAAQWLAIRLDLISAVSGFFIAALAAATGTAFIPAGYLALALTYSLNMTQFLKFAVRMIATCEANMNSVERIQFYTDEIEQEGGLSAKRSPPPDDWPTKGVVEAKNVCLRYRDGPLVLQDVSFTTKDCEKIGIAGRTGSGKSSLMTALFRLVELDDGVIKIDGRDCSLIPLKTLRSKIGIIPQDPVMFSASVRFNLDPFDQHTDKEIWDILDIVELKETVQSLPDMLGEMVAESGENFSAGQRQLICIARALLRRPKVLVLDEATASVDNETDSRMQVTIRERFKDCTVLTIAHRLHTIMDSDRVMVLEQGVLAEMDAPSTLLAQDGGMLKALWERHQLSHGASIGSHLHLAGLSAQEETKDIEEEHEDDELGRGGTRDIQTLNDKQLTL
mmetsp:Transcript_18265/g.18335  ORF Transcript_18265/g.18335 Transcript_18265/m.18335 type:complete len:1458 (-) Transcript_18265:212-4585(-)|eukprot:CAMPEP_0182428042 /NCGR_PEP_ID=MMETSP1167-20130531/20974_1 /TAXON_ID=2988 /ORGANISM="Mallomonas Sp, Strain CCMP3275" /LENGTH=1457 /DNA_ID=CAMNT_0024610683 /DNA_START=24 /DNA_END=4397 /DNA_ORIENTATION=-